MKVRAPKRLSTAIMMALNDLALVEQDPTYTVNMWRWHDSEGMSGKCAVCFAGSIFAKTFKKDPDACLSPTNFSTDWENVFWALDEVRQGDVGAALQHMGFSNGGYEELYRDFMSEIAGYYENPKRFKEAMCDLAAMLKVNGL